MKMKMKIELVYFEGCPNVEAARENLRRAFNDLGLEADWLEWDQGNDNAPEHVKAFGSPSILVDGKDVAGDHGECCAPQSCRLYDGGKNAPSVENIKTAVKAGM